MTGLDKYRIELESSSLCGGSTASDDIYDALCPPSSAMEVARRDEIRRKRAFKEQQKLENSPAVNELKKLREIENDQKEAIKSLKKELEEERSSRLVAEKKARKFNLISFGVSTSIALISILVSILASVL